MEGTITSLQNPKVKQMLALQQKSSERRKTGLFVVEGWREVDHCLQGDFDIVSAFVCPQYYPASLSKTLPSHVSCVEVSPQVYAKMAYRGGTEGILAVVRSKALRLEDLRLPDKPLIIILEGVEKPGNLGAILRSADASGVDAVIVCDPLTDLYNPNLIRASIGAVFSVPCVVCDSASCIDFLHGKGIHILTAQLQDSQLYYHVDMCRPTAIVMGTESTGLTQQWRTAADAHIRIPMLGKLDSLNVSVSAAILLFEAVRQRKE